VVALDAKGKPLAGFPAMLFATEASASPLAYDLAGDGTPTVFVGLPNGQLHGLRAQKLGSVPGRVAWGGAGRDPARAGRYGPNPPSYKDLAIAPEKPHALQPMKASWRGAWLDALPGDSAPPPRIEWQRNGKAVAALDGKRELPPGTVRRGERWRFVLASPKGDATAQSGEAQSIEQKVMTLEQQREALATQAQEARSGWHAATSRLSSLKEELARCEVSARELSQTRAVREGERVAAVERQVETEGGRKTAEASLEGLVASEAEARALADDARKRTLGKREIVQAEEESLRGLRHEANARFLYYERDEAGVAAARVLIAEVLR
jgi:hypothetical protein